MVRKPVSRARLAVVILSCVGMALAAASVPAFAQVPTTAQAQESASDALSRHLRVLTASPRNFQSLIGAGRAALDLGDTQAAAGFFGRADEVWPTSPLPQIGMGAAAALDGDPQEALRYFERARGLGASAVTMGADRGLAYDLLGRASEAQADYRAALAGSEADEARRRLALSLAISGDQPGALEALSPLLVRRDHPAFRTRALVLALSGDQLAARQAMEGTMPGAWAQMGPFLGRLGTLNAAQKAAAVHLGIFPGAGQPGIAIAQTQRDRLADIESILGAPQQPVQTVAAAPAPAPPPPVPNVQQPVSGVPLASVSATTVTGAPQRKRFWVQVASGPNAEALPAQYAKIKARSDHLLDGINGYVADEPGKSRLLVGPFRDANDARVFAEDLETVRVSAFSWTSAEGQAIRKITTE